MVRQITRKKRVAEEPITPMKAPKSELEKIYAPVGGIPFVCFVCFVVTSDRIVPD
jgi:hypothetical protein